MTRVLGVLVAAWLACGGVSLAQTLVEISKKTVSGTDGTRSFALGMAPACDADGAILLAPVQPPRAKLGSLWLISPDGKQVNRIDTTSFRGFQSAGLVSASLGPGGDLFLLMGIPQKEGAGRRAVLTVDRKGRVTSTLSLDDSHWLRFAPFSSGKFLVSGSRNDESAELAVIDSSGKTTAAVKPPRAQDGRPGKIDGETPTLDDRRWVDLTMAESTTDDHVWIVRPDVRGPAYEVDSSGEVVRSLELVPPPGATALLMVKVSRRRIAALYAIEQDDSAKKSQVISVFDTDSGNRVADYSGSGLGVLSCFTNDDMGDSFRFVAVEPSGLVLRTVAPR